MLIILKYAVLYPVEKKKEKKDGLTVLYIIISSKKQSVQFSMVDKYYP